MIAADNIAFSTWLRATLVARFPYVVTQKTLAESLNISPNTVYGWLHGLSTPPRTIVPQLAAALDVSEEEIVSGASIDRDFLAQRELQRAHGENARRRERYLNDAVYRARILSRRAVPQHKKSKARLHQEWVMCLPEADREAVLRFRHSEKAAKRKALKLRLGENFTAKEFWAKAMALGYCCCLCGVSRADLLARGQDLTADHVYPLALVNDPDRRHLASNSIDAVFPACFSCNSSKGARDLMEWAEWKGLTNKLHPAVVAHYQSWPTLRKSECTTTP